MLTNQYYRQMKETNPMHAHLGDNYTSGAQEKNCTEKMCIYKMRETDLADQVASRLTCRQDPPGQDEDC